MILNFDSGIACRAKGACHNRRAHDLGAVGDDFELVSGIACHKERVLTGARTIEIMLLMILNFHVVASRVLKETCLTGARFRLPVVDDFELWKLHRVS
jgi:hypothetical protein